MAFLVETSWVHIRWIDDEANSVIRAIRSKDSSDGVMEQIFKTEGYRRLNDRETGMGRPLAKKDFINCITDSKSTADDYSKTLDEWAKLDFNALGNRSAAYLPKNAKLEASVYPLIKPYSNSFVWDVEKNPAIMLYLDPKKSAAEVAMTVTHELHHIGYASCCPNSPFKEWIKKQSSARQETWKWIGAFGEGYAVLAASTDPKDPIGPSAPEVKEAWNEGITHLDRDFRKLEEFFTEALSGKLTPAQTQAKAVVFYGNQGPWYTVGFVLATTIEKAFGRSKLIECYADPRLLFERYNAAVAKISSKDPKWSIAIVEALKAKN